MSPKGTLASPRGLWGKLPQTGPRIGGKKRGAARWGRPSQKHAGPAGQGPLRPVTAIFPLSSNSRTIQVLVVPQSTQNACSLSNTFRSVT